MQKQSIDSLMICYDGLSPLGKFLVQLSSIIYLPTNPTAIYRTISQSGISYPGEQIKSPKILEVHLRELETLGLLDHQFRCRKEFMERASKLAVIAGHYQAMAKAVQKIMPLRDVLFESRSKLCSLFMRDFRIGIYTGDVDLCNRTYSELYYRCGDTWLNPDPFIQVCGMPFERDWFSTLPPALQVPALTATFYQTLTHLKADDQCLEFALDRSFLRKVAQPLRSSLYHHLAVRLLMGGRLTEAAPLIQTLSAEGVTGGLLGWLHLIEGKVEKATDLFEVELTELRKRLGKRNALFHGIPGLFFILALLLRQDGGLIRRVDHLLSSAESKYGNTPSLRPAYNALRAIYHIQNCEPETAREALAASEKHQDSLSIFFSAYASYWLDNRLTTSRIDALSNLFIRAREIGLHWLAMECAELLCRAERDTPVRRNYIDKVEEESGARSLVAHIPLEEGWQKSLRALIQAASAQQTARGQGPDTRLVWLVHHAGGVFDLQPVEQKLGAKGVWTKGRPVSLARFYNGTKLEYISKQDQLIRSALSKTYSYYRGHTYHFDMEKVLPALVAHPLVFLKQSSSLRAEVVKGEPEIMVTEEGSELKVQFSPKVNDSRVVVVQETPSRFKVIELTDEQRRMARIVGEKGLTIPQTAKEEVVSAISAISSRVMVHSAIGGAMEDIAEAEADPTPHVHLLPMGPGFSLEVFVKPFRDGGPYLKPGQGTQNVIAEVGGKRLLTRRDLPLEERMANLIEQHCPALGALPDGDRQWKLEITEDCLQVLLGLKALQDKGEVVVEWPEGEKLRVTREVSFDRMHLAIRSRNDWFEVSGQLVVDDGLVLDMRRILELLHTTQTRFIPLGEGQYLALTRELRRRLEELEAYSDKRGKEYRIHPLASLALEEFAGQVGNIEADEAWRSRIKRFQAAEDFHPQVPSTLKAELRQYQVEGFQWLGKMAHLGVGGCLADDMGLGKTLQALAILLDRAPRGPALVVAPTSVCMNWTAETNRFAPTLNPVPFGGVNREEMIKKLGPFDVLISSYGLLLQEAELLSSLHWSTIVLDEAQAIKNMTTKRSQAAMSLNGDFKLITTGTPIENHLSEFWTLFNFINPGLLGSFKRFNERFAVPIEKYANRDARRRLKRLIRPFILRRVKSEVLEELPPRTEVILQVEMNPEEAAFYEALRRQAIERLERDAAPAGQKHLKILAEIMRLRLACCNAKLVAPETGITSSKLDLFGEIVTELLENNHKALVFSQFVRHLDLIRGHLDEKKIDYRYLDGSTPPKERQKEVDAFQAGVGDLFLISLRAGGLGLNLTAADYVIHMDPWWNPAVEDQAADRAHRIGQQHPVTIYKLVTRNTIEEKIVKLHQEKRDLATSLLDGTDISGKISAEELLQLIRED